MSELDPRYVAARRVLLDALVALGAQSSAVVIAGAQAVYLRAGSADLAIAPFTTDADLSVDPERLASEPVLEAAMRGAGFELAVVGGHVEPGIWMREVRVGELDIVVPVDLIVPEAFAPPGGRRGARLGVHGRRAARRAIGLEACLVDNDTMRIAALEADDSRAVHARVAGPGALLVAKSHKIGDRLARGKADRLVDKDAADVLRLMQTSDPHEVGATLRGLSLEGPAAEVTSQSLALLEAQFGRRGRPGIAMASRALRIAMPAERVEALCVAYTSRLLEAARASESEDDDRPSQPGGQP